MKGVILAGGSGTRLKPLTQIMNKHLLPVGRSPMIFWPILKLKEAGIKEILIVTNDEHLHSFKKVLGNGEEFNVNLKFQTQVNEGGGIADALMCAQNFINEEKFVVILGDNVFEDSLSPYVTAFIAQDSGARVLLKEVKDPTRYGVPQIDREGQRILSIIEKPSNPPSSYCVTGIYMYDKSVFNYINSIKPSNRNELEITDVNNLYIQNDLLQFDILKGWWIDAGTHESLYQANQYSFQSFKKGGDQ
ncbi:MULTISPECIES: sugar phosphate nucleotidyltransferase [unclassified Cytobacillus]|uniref:sugar phosphate nucleotidyltransferase n=1 Tax=unclassified Cytobacillus TaxID=2675268 RepID=UPI001358E022|nr:sugar phosphate nucleotidyltransferase [Cytobacillus sp. AMY 15.2]KAF0817844.1 Glucose-1-phosphate thymidylyltransferase [Bacillus sp. ZZV12-4809]MCM3089937.1 sugar phosphate nucleotidyltransferase [Cytobacillus sp. AMY 15.2]